jgi:serpin B
MRPRSTRLFKSLIFLALAALVAGGPVLFAADAPAPEDATVSTNRLALDLYGQLRAGGGNVFFSPHSIASALAMTYAGARGQTADEMRDVLHLGHEADAVHARFAALDQALEERDGVELAVANALWGQEGFGFREPFLESLERHYGAGLRRVDFDAGLAAAVAEINRWVAKQTNDRIEQLVAEDSFTPPIRLVLTNAIYFKGAWAQPFDERATREGPFHLAGGGTVTVPLMRQKSGFRYQDGDGFAALELPYEGEEIAMLVVLPDEVGGLEALERSLTPEMLEGWIDDLQDERVDVVLPRFRLETRYALADHLAELGMSSAFDRETADFSGITGRRDLFISAVIHKAFVETDEEGTEAAAATAVGMALTSVPAPPKTFHADRPFLFLVRDRETGAVLFLGRIANPAAG